MSKTTIPPITKGALDRIFNGETSFKPTLMVLSTKPPKPSQQQASVTIGDGGRYTTAIISPLMIVGLKKNSVVTLKNFFCTTVNDRDIIVILDMEHHQEDQPKQQTSGPTPNEFSRSKSFGGGILEGGSGGGKTVVNGQPKVPFLAEQSRPTIKKSTSFSSRDFSQNNNNNNNNNTNTNTNTNRTRVEPEIKSKEQQQLQQQDQPKINPIVKESPNLPPGVVLKPVAFKRSRSSGFFEEIRNSGEKKEMDLGNHNIMSNNGNSNTQTEEGLRRTVSMGGQEFRRVSSRTYMVSLPAIAERQVNSFSPPTSNQTQSTTGPSTNEIAKRSSIRPSIRGAASFGALTEVQKEKLNQKKNFKKFWFRNKSVAVEPSYPPPPPENIIQDDDEDITPPKEPKKKKKLFFSIFRRKALTK